MAKHSRLYSSRTVSILMGRPSWVRSATKSYDHTWCLYKGLRRMQEPSFSQILARVGCFFGTFSPSCFQIRSTRLWFTDQPSALSIPVTIRYPYLPYLLARFTTSFLSASSSSFT